MVSGSIIIIQSLKPMFMAMPLGSLRNLMAIALGGVPIGVAIPPRLAPTGMARARARRPLPFAGRDLMTGVRNVSIMAAVAVLDRNIENTPVTRMNPSRTFSDFVPKGLSNALANLISNPALVAANASMKPPMKSMMTGSAKQAMIFLLDIRVPNSGSSAACSLNRLRLLSLAVNRSTTIMATDVAHDGIPSVIHIMVAKQNTAITRCSITVRLSIPNTLEGRFQTTSPTITPKRTLSARKDTGITAFFCAFFLSFSFTSSEPKNVFCIIFRFRGRSYAERQSVFIGEIYLFL